MNNPYAMQDPTLATQATPAATPNTTAQQQIDYPAYPNAYGLGTQIGSTEDKQNKDAGVSANDSSHGFNPWSLLRRVKRSLINSIFGLNKFYLQFEKKY